MRLLYGLLLGLYLSNVWGSAPASSVRWQASEGVVQGMIARLVASDVQSDAHDPNRIAGFRIVPGSGRPLDPDLLADLVHWLRAEDGFIEGLARRCRRDQAVGFRLQRQIEGQMSTAEIAVDFPCNALFLRVLGPGSPRTAYCFFDPSRADLLAIVTRALGKDWLEQP